MKKPSEYPEQVLKALYQRYKQTGDISVELTELRQLSGVPANSVYNALKIIMQEGWIEDGPEGQPYFTYISSDGTHSIITLSAKGISAGEQLMRPWYYKVPDAIRAVGVAIIEGVTRGLTKP